MPSLLHIYPFSHPLSPFICELELKILAITSLTLLTNASPCHISSPSSSPCELCFWQKPHTEFVLCFGSVPTSGALEGSDEWVPGSAVRHNRGCKLVNQCCCLLSQIARYCLSVATASAITQHSARACCKAKLCPFSFFPAKVYQFEMIHVSVIPVPYFPCDEVTCKTSGS